MSTPLTRAEVSKQFDKFEQTASGLNFQHLEASLVSLEEYIVQLKSGQLAPDVQNYILQTGLAKVLIAFLKEGPYLTPDGVSRTHGFLRKVLEIIVEFGFSLNSVALTEVLMLLFDHTTSYYCKIRHPLTDTLKLNISPLAATVPKKGASSVFVCDHINFFFSINGFDQAWATLQSGKGSITLANNILNAFTKIIQHKYLDRSLVVACAENFCSSIPKRFLYLTDDDLRTIRKEEFTSILKNTTEKLTALAAKVPELKEKTNESLRTMSIEVARQTFHSEIFDKRLFGVACFNDWIKNLYAYQQQQHVAQQAAIEAQQKQQTTSASTTVTGGTGEDTSNTASEKPATTDSESNASATGTTLGANESTGANNASNIAGGSGSGSPGTPQAVGTPGDVKASNPNANSQHKNKKQKGQGGNNNNQQNAPKEPFLVFDKAEALVEWFSQHKLINSLYGLTKHANIIKETNYIFQFMTRYDALSQEDLELIIDCIKNAHSSISTEVLQIVANAGQTLKDHHYDTIIKFYASLPPESINYAILNFSFQMTYNMMNDIKHRVKFFDLLLNIVTANRYSLEMSQFALQSIQNIFRGPTDLFISFKLGWAQSLFQNILSNVSSAFSSNLLGYVIASFPPRQQILNNNAANASNATTNGTGSATNNAGTASNNTSSSTANPNQANAPLPNPPQIDIATVQTQESFLALLSADFEGNIVGPILAGMEELAVTTAVQYADQSASCPFDEFTVGDRKMTYYSEMSYRLQLLELLVNIAPPESEELRAILSRVWAIFLGSDKPRTAHQVSLCVDFFRKLRRAYVGGSRNGPSAVLKDNDVVWTFQSLFQRQLQAVAMIPASFYAFQHFFLDCNAFLGRIKYKDNQSNMSTFAALDQPQTDKFSVIALETDLEGYETLWAIVLDARDQVVVEASMKFLNSLHESIDSAALANTGTGTSENIFLAGTLKRIQDTIIALNEKTAADLSQSQLKRKSDYIQRLERCLSLLLQLIGVQSQTVTTSASNAGGAGEISVKSTALAKQQQQQATEQSNTTAASSVVDSSVSGVSSDSPSRYELLDCVSGSRDMISKPIRVRVIQTLFPAEVLLEPYDDYETNSERQRAEILKGGNWNKGLQVQQNAFYLDVSNRCTLAQLRTLITEKLNSGGQQEMTESDLILSLLDKGIGVANSGKGNINLDVNTYSNKESADSVYQRSLEQLDIISGAVFTVSVNPSIRERQTANRKIAEFRMTSPENDEKNLPKGAEDDAKTLQEIYSVSRDLAIFALKEKYWNINAVINVLMDPSDRQLLTEKAQRAGVAIHPSNDSSASHSHTEAPVRRVVNTQSARWVITEEDHFDKLFQLFRVNDESLQNKVSLMLAQLPPAARVDKLLRGNKWSEIFGLTEDVFTLLYNTQVVDSYLFPVDTASSNTDQTTPIASFVSLWRDGLFESGLTHMFTTLLQLVERLPAVPRQSEKEIVSNMLQIHVEAITRLLRLAVFICTSKLSPNNAAALAQYGGASSLARPQSVASDQPAFVFEQALGTNLVASLGKLFGWLKQGYSTVARSWVSSLVCYSTRLLTIILTSDNTGASMESFMKMNETGELNDLKDIFLLCRHKKEKEEEDLCDELISGMVILVQKLVQHPARQSRHRYLSFFYRLLAEMESREINNHPAYASCLFHCRQFYFLFNSVIQHIIDENLFADLIESEASNQSVGEKELGQQLVRLIGEIRNRRLLETRTVADEVLAGKLRVFATLSSHHALLPYLPATLMEGGFLVYEILGYLFPLQQSSTNDQSTSTTQDASSAASESKPSVLAEANGMALNTIKCLTVNTREQAFRALISLSMRAGDKGTEANYETLIRALQDQFNSFTTGHIRKSGWNYQPGVEDKVLDFVGLNNLGATCYQNALLQQFYNIGTLRNSILTVDPATTTSPKKADEENMLVQLQKLFANLKLSVMKSVDPTAFVKTYRDMDGRQVSHQQQQDVDEFFNRMTSELETLLKGTCEEQLLKEAFGVVLSNEICSKQPQEFPWYSENPEYCLSIPLEVKGTNSLHQALDALIAKDTLEGDNAYYCSKYQRKIDATKRYCIKSLSDNLIFNLKRFDYDFNQGIKIKLNDYFHFPRDINMLPWTQQGLNGNIPEDQVIDESRFLYELTGILVHTGGAESGHYYSYVKQGNRWYEFNDKRVDFFNIDQSLVDECFGGRKYVNVWDSMKKMNVQQEKEIEKSAYMLFYSRVLRKADDAQFSIPRHLCNSIQKQNEDFLKDLYFFDNEFFDFMLASMQFLPLTAQSATVPLLTTTETVATSETVVTGSEPPSTTTAAVVSAQAPNMQQVHMEMATKFVFEVLVRSNRKDSLVQWRTVLQRVFLFSPQLALTFLNAMKLDPAWAHVPNGGGGVKKSDSLYIEAENNLLRDMLVDCPVERTRIYTEDIVCAALAAVSTAELKQQIWAKSKKDLGSSVACQTMWSLYTMLGHSRKHWKQYRQYHEVFLRFALMGFQQRDFLFSEIDFFLDIKLFYMNSAQQGRHSASASLMDNDYHSDLRALLDCFKVFVLGCENAYTQELDYARGQNQTVDTANHVPSPYRLTGQLHPYSPDKFEDVLFENYFFSAFLEMGYNNQAAADIIRHSCWQCPERSLWAMIIVLDSLHRTQEYKLFIFGELLVAMLGLEDFLQEKRIQWAFRPFQLQAGKYSLSSKVKGLLATTKDVTSPAQCKYLIHLILYLQQLYPKVREYLVEKRSELLWMKDYLTTLLEANKEEIPETAMTQPSEPVKADSSDEQPTGTDGEKKPEEKKEELRVRFVPAPTRRCPASNALLYQAVSDLVVISMTSNTADAGNTMELLRKLESSEVEARKLKIDNEALKSEIDTIIAYYRAKCPDIPPPEGYAKTAWTKAAAKDEKHHQTHIGASNHREGTKNNSDGFEMVDLNGEGPSSGEGGTELGPLIGPKRPAHMADTTEEGLNLAEFLHNDREKNQGKNGSSINQNNKRERDGESSGVDGDSSCGSDMPPLLITYPEGSQSNSGVVNLNKRDEPSEPSDIMEKINMLTEFFPYLGPEVLRFALKDKRYDAEAAANALFDPSNVEKYEMQMTQLT